VFHKLLILLTQRSSLPGELFGKARAITLQSIELIFEIESYCIIAFARRLIASKQVLICDGSYQMKTSRRVFRI
jgi:hypothetical protein